MTQTDAGMLCIHYAWSAKVATAPIRDELSRVYAPTGAGMMTPDLHPAMKGAIEATAPKRDATFYRL